MVMDKVDLQALIAHAETTSTYSSASAIRKSFKSRYPAASVDNNDVKRILIFFGGYCIKIQREQDRVIENRAEKHLFDVAPDKSLLSPVVSISTNERVLIMEADIPDHFPPSRFELAQEHRLQKRGFYLADARYFDPKGRMVNYPYVSHKDLKFA